MRPATSPAKPIAGKESKVQRVARGGFKQTQKPVGFCTNRKPISPEGGYPEVCGGPLLWVQYSPQHGNPKMRRYCDRCFTYAQEVDK